MVEKSIILTLSILFLILCLIAVRLSDLLLQSSIKFQKLEREFDLVHMIMQGIKLFPKRQEYRADIRVGRELFERNNLPEGYLERKLVEQAIQKLPLDQIISLFNIEHLDPREEINSAWPMWKINKILELRQQYQHEFRATLFIDQP